MDAWEKFLEKREEINQEKIIRPRRLFSDRRFNVIGYKNKFVNGRWYNRKFITIENVGVNSYKKEESKLRKLGCYRVDVIEVNTTANEKIGKSVVARNMEFAKQVFAAANNKFVPMAIVPPKPGDKQMTIAWEIIPPIEKTWLDNRPIVKVKDRQNAVKAERKRSAMFSKINAEQNEIEEMKIFDKASGGFMFSSADKGDVIEYIRKHNLTPENIVLYVSNEIFWQLRGLE